MILYPYQEQVLLAIQSDPSHSQLISMPTGTGKTITFLSACRNIRKRCLVLVHRDELLNQTYEKAKLCGFEESEISIINADKKDEFRLLNIAMVQTLTRNLEKYDSSFIEMIVVDEAHHSTALSYRSVFSYFRIFEEKKHLLGFTATPLRGDKQALGDIYLSHSFKMTLSEATQSGYICPVHGARIDIQKSLEFIESSQGDYDIQQLEKVMNCDSINELIAAKCEYLQKVPSIIFCTSVDHAIQISKKLRQRNRKAISISYKNSKKGIARIFQLIKEGKVEFITNAVKLSEGFDYPPIQTIVLARPTRSPVLYKQMIGRGLRNSPDKNDCFVMEFAGNDPKMICWEDIDQNATFQSFSEAQKVTRKDALNFYRNRFGGDVKILDVRISPFHFYECRVRRLQKFKKFYYIPHEKGFTLFNPVLTLSKSRETGFNLMCYEVFWEKTYQSLYVWNTPDFLYFEPFGHNTHHLVPMIKFYGDRQCGGDLGKWYPSEEEPMTAKQKTMLKVSEKLSARKAEMLIEDIAIKKSIQKHWIDGSPTGVMKL